jgi:hypothetical protein
MEWLVPYQFKPGQSGNPKGRPKGRTLTDLMSALLDAHELCGEPTPGGRTVGQVLVESWVSHAVKRGDAALIREILDRVEGKIVPAPPGPVVTLIDIPDDEPDVEPRPDPEVEGGMPGEFPEVQSPDPR